MFENRVLIFSKFALDYVIMVYDTYLDANNASVQEAIKLVITLLHNISPFKPLVVLLYCFFYRLLFL